MIKKLEVNGYRLLNGFVADLGELTVVIGANATGKSTLLDFLHFMAQAVDGPLNSALRDRGGISSVLTAASGASTVDWRVHYAFPAINPFWLPHDWAGTEFVYEASLAEVPNYGAVPHHELLLATPPDHASPVTLLEFDKGIGKVFDTKARQLVMFTESAAVAKDLFAPSEQQAGGEYRPPRGMDASKGLFLPGSRGPSLLLSQIDYPANFAEACYQRALLSSTAYYPGFGVGPGSALRIQPCDVESTTLLSSQGENLAGVLHAMLSSLEHRDSAERLKDCLRAAYEHFMDLAAQPVFGAKGKVAIRWQEEGLTRDLWPTDLSDGVLRFLCLAVALNNPVPPALILIDEPEVGLHPKLLPIVADMLKSAAEETQVLVTTHSPHLLDCFGLEDLAVMIRDGTSVRWHRPSTRAALKVLLETVGGQTLGDMHRSGELEAIG